MEWSGRSMRWEVGRPPTLASRVAAARRVVQSPACRHLVLVLAIAGAILLLDQAARPLAQSRLPPGTRIPLLGGRLVFERVDDAASAATLALLRVHLAVGLAALLAMTVLTRYMGWYGVTLLAAFGLILGGAESNHLSLLAFGFVLNWIGYRIDGPTMVLAPADLVQMAGLAIVTSALTLFTAATIAEVLPDEPGRGGPVGRRRAGRADAGWDRTSMIGARGTIPLRPPA